MNEPRITDIYDLRVRDVIWYVWGRLPYEARARLRGVTIKAAPSGYHAPGSAGTDDIWLRLPLPRNLDREVVAHEMAHVYCSHVARMARGEISTADAEAEAERLATSWLRQRN